MCGFSKFSPLGGPAGRRIVYGVVYRHGMPQHRIAVARFSLPRISLRPAAPKVHVVHTHSGVSVRFTRVGGAARYAVSVNISDGRVISRILKRGHDLFIARGGSQLSAQAMVWAITSSKIVGRPGSGYAPPARRHKHHLRHRRR
jgi:hypothetical protein